MFCRWSRTVAGTYFIKDKSIGLDYQTLASDPLEAQMILVHEGTHNILNNTTEYGLATSEVFNIINKVKEISPQENKVIKKLLYSNQVLVQEGTASLVEILILQHKYNKTFALDWAHKNFPKDYLDRFNKLKFVMDFSQKYRDLFRNRMPIIALQTDIRKVIVEQDLLRNPQRFIKYLSTEIYVPDKRYEKMIEKIRYGGGIMNKQDNVICQGLEINYFPPLDKKGVASYLNYIQEVLDKGSYFFTEKDITEAKKPKELLQSSLDEAVVTNLNIDLANSGVVEWNINDFLHYKDSIEAIVVSRLGDDERKDIYKIVTGKNCEASIIGFTKTNEKYITAVDAVTLSQLLNNEFKNTTLIVKWGLYRAPNEKLDYFPDSRRPDVVIYNTIGSLRQSFQSYFDQGGKANYIWISLSKDHPFQTLVLEDINNVLHLVNTIGNKLVDSFIDRNKNNLTELAPKDGEIKHPNHFNNVCCVWMNLSWNHDIYQTIKNNKEIFR